MAKKNKEVKFLTNIMDRPIDDQMPVMSRPGVFSDLMISKRDEVIKPYAHYLDERALGIALKEYYGNFEANADETLRAAIKRILAKKRLKDPHPNDWKTVCQLVTVEFADYAIKEHVYNDLFTLFYNPIDRLNFEDKVTENAAKFKMIEYLNNPVLKVITFHNPVKTMVIIRAMITHLLIRIVFGKYGVDLDDAEDIKDLLDMLGQKQNPAPAQPGIPGGQPVPGGQPGQGTQSNESSQQSHSKTAPSVQEQQYAEDFTSGQPQQPDPAQNGQLAQQPFTPDPQAQPGSTGAPDGQQGQGQPEASPQPVKTAEGHNLIAETNTNSAGSGNSEIAKPEDQLDKIMTRMYEDPDSKKLLEQTIESARENIQNIEKLITEESMSDMWEDLNIDKKELLARIDPGMLKSIEKELKKVTVKEGGLKEKIKHLLDKSVNYFSSKETIKFENILEADDLSQLIDIELLHPRLRKPCLEDIMVKTSKKIGKINGYVDVSGSMDSSSGAKDSEGNVMSRSTLAKAITLKIKQMDLLDQLYTFEDSVHPTGNELIDVLLMDGNGGTSLENVVSHIQQNKKNSLIITDACDYVSTYSPYAFFIGVAGARFSSFDDDALRKYVNGNQIVVFDGVNVLNVDYDGNTIHKNK